MAKAMAKARGGRMSAVIVMGVGVGVGLGVLGLLGARMVSGGGGVTVAAVAVTMMMRMMIIRIITTIGTEVAVVTWPAAAAVGVVWSRWWR
jgi:hypothetical protein